MENRTGYDQSIGTERRSAVGFTKTWAIVAAILGIIGIVVLAMLFFGDGSAADRGGTATDNTASRPAEP